MSEKIGIIIPTYNRIHHTRKIVTDLLTQFEDHQIEIAICDSGSTDGTQKFCKTIGLTIIQLSPSDYWSSTVNSGLRYFSDRALRYIIIMNDDVEINEGFSNQILSIIKTQNLQPSAFVASQKSITGHAFYGYSICNSRFNLLDRPVDDSKIFASNGCFLLLCNVLLKEVFVQDKLYPHYYGDLSLYFKLVLNQIPITLCKNIMIQQTSHTNRFSKENPITCFLKKRSPYYLPSMLAYPLQLALKYNDPKLGVRFFLNQCANYFVDAREWLRHSK